MWHLKKTQCLIHTFTSAELLFSYSVVLDSLRPPRTAAPQASLFFTIFWSLLKLTSIESVSHPMIHSLSPLLFLPSVFPSIRVISNELVLGSRWPKYWSFSLSISLSNEYSGLIAFKIDCWSPCCPRDSQESSPAPQFESLNSLVLSLVYGPILTTWLLERS